MDTILWTKSLCHYFAEGGKVKVYNRFNAKQERVGKIEKDGETGVKMICM